MKLANFADGTRNDSCLVSRDLAYATDARGIAKTLQDALDDWVRLAPKLKHSRVRLKSARCPASGSASTRRARRYPRAFQWIDGSAYLSHVELVRKARGAAMPPELWTDPLLYQGGSDAFCSRGSR